MAGTAILPSDDATVTAGGQSTTNFGAASTLRVALSPSAAQEGTSAALFKFPLTSLTAGKVIM